jgi:gliding motility-associated-like protein
MRVFLIVLNLLIVSASFAQPCTNAGQTPSTAFPVCGTSVFDQGTVPTCVNATLPSPQCQATGVVLQDLNPYWYKFTCFTSGTLGFLITPRNLADDYDWELYDVTNANPNDVYRDASLVVASNWSGEVGLTGASAAGTTLFSCAGTGQPLFTRLVPLQAGRNYLLMVSHYTPTQSGYSLQFTGGTANINDPNIPHLQNATANCGGDLITIKLNKKIKCSSLAGNGSDFFITPSLGTPLSVTGFGCSAGFDTDSIQLRLSNFLPPGNYTLGIKAGSDGNTLLDYCNNAMPASDVATFNVTPAAPAEMDTLKAASCSPNTLQITFDKAVVCASIAANGSDFTVNGPSAITVTGATTTCNTNGLTNSVILNLSQPLQRAGLFTVRLQVGSDGNTILNECGIPTASGESISFPIADTVNADFTYNIDYDCVADVVNFFHAGGNGVNNWRWTLDNGFTSTQQNPQATYTVFTTKQIQLIVSNGFCSDTSRTSFVLDNFLKADFSVLEDNCPVEPVLFTSNSAGRIVRHDWDFGDGGFGIGATPTHSFTTPGRETVYNVRYTATDSFGCSKTVQKSIKIYNSCTIAVPNAFTPNGDRVNPTLYPLNAIKAENLQFTVYNRWGQMVFQTNSWKRGWDGTLNGRPQPSGTYVWMLRYINRDTKQRVEKKGFTILIR